MFSPAIAWREYPQRYRLEAARCTGCGKILYPPRVVCPACRCRTFEARWQAAGFRDWLVKHGVTHTSLVPAQVHDLTAAGVAANVLLVALAGVVGLRPFFGRQRATPKQPHEAPPALWRAATVAASPASATTQPTRHPHSAQLLEAERSWTTVRRSGSKSAGRAPVPGANRNSP